MNTVNTAPYRYAIILDFEATCDDVTPPKPQEIIEFPSVLVALESLATVAEFEAFVRPLHHPQLTPFCTTLTHIQQSDIDGAEAFPAVFARHMAWLDRYGLTAQNALIVTCGDWDLRTMLPTQCAAVAPPITALRPIYRRWQNIKTLFNVVTGTRGRSMPAMLAALNLPLVGRHHRGIDDCRNIAELYKALLRQGGSAQPTTSL